MFELTRARNIVWLAGLVVSMAGSATAQEAEAEKKTVGWFNSTELSLVVTEGNSKTDSLGFKNRLTRKWEGSDFRLSLDAVRSDTADDPFLLVEPGLIFLPGETPTTFDTSLVTPAKDPDVEMFFLEGRYTRKFNKKRRTWNTGGSWDRNEDAGILNRYIVFGGLGNVWKQGKKLDIHTGYGLSFTDREEETPDPEKEARFPGFRATVDLDYRILKSTTLEYRLTGNLNLEDRSDYSIDTAGSLSVSMNKRLALKASVQFLFNSEPALEDGDIVARLQLVDPDLIPGNGDEFFVTVAEGGAEVELGEGQFRKTDLDTVFRTSLVINF